jgi:zinc transport system substrate-binding protein
MLRKPVILLVLLLVSWGPHSPKSLQAAEPGKPLQVLCTILPVYIFTMNVVGQVPGIDVKLLLSSHQGCPHNYDLTPGDLMKLSRADLIVANGLGMESFLTPFLKGQKTRHPLIEAARKIVPIPEEPAEATKGGSKTHHDHVGELNGHAWVSPEGASVMVNTIAEGLALQYPAHAREFLANGRAYARKLEALSREMKAVVAGAKNRKVIAFHDILAYLARDIGLTVVAVVETQLGLEPSSRDMIRLIQTAKKERVAAIFSEPPYSDKVVRALARESGLPFYPFDPVAAGKPAADTYEQVMKKNIEVLRKALL